MPTPFIPTDDGRWVNSDFERLARNIQDYDQNLQLCWIPPEKRTREDKKPYAVVDTRTQTVVLHAGELDSPAEILTNLYLADGSNGNVLDRIEAHNLAIENLRTQEWADQREDMRDQALFLVKSPLNTLKFNGKKLDHLRRPVL
jgi:hypothetical protein